MCAFDSTLGIADKPIRLSVQAKDDIARMLGTGRNDKILRESIRPLLDAIDRAVSHYLAAERGTVDTARTSYKKVIDGQTGKPTGDYEEVFPPADEPSRAKVKAQLKRLKNPIEKLKAAIDSLDPSVAAELDLALSAFGSRLPTFGLMLGELDTAVDSTRRLAEQRLPGNRAPNEHRRRLVLDIGNAFITYLGKFPTTTRNRDSDFEFTILRVIQAANAEFHAGLNKNPENLHKTAVAVAQELKSIHSNPSG